MTEHERALAASLLDEGSTSPFVSLGNVVGIEATPENIDLVNEARAWCEKAPKALVREGQIYTSRALLMAYCAHLLREDGTNGQQE